MRRRPIRPQDQRHRCVRLFGTWETPLPKALGRLYLRVSAVDRHRAALRRCGYGQVLAPRDEPGLRDAASSQQSDLLVHRALFLPHSTLCCTDLALTWGINVGSADPRSAPGPEPLQRSGHRLEPVEPCSTRRGGDFRESEGTTTNPSEIFSMTVPSGCTGHGRATLTTRPVSAPGVESRAHTSSRHPPRLDGPSLRSSSRPRMRRRLTHAGGTKLGPMKSSRSSARAAGHGGGRHRARDILVDCRIA